MIVRITKCENEAWYKNNIDDAFILEPESENEKYYYAPFNGYILKADCELVETETPANQVTDDPDNECGDIIDRVTQLEAENKKLKEDRAFLENKYERIRELVGALNLGDRDIFDATETAILRMKKESSDLRDQNNETEKKNKETLTAVISILDPIAERQQIMPDYYPHNMGHINNKPRSILDLAKDCNYTINKLNSENKELWHRLDKMCQIRDGLIDALAEMKNRRYKGYCSGDKLNE